MQLPYSEFLQEHEELGHMNQSNEDRKLQRILWRRGAEEPFRTYEPSTVTASAPYLATNCLQQLAEDQSKDFSLAPETLTNNCG